MEYIYKNKKDEQIILNFSIGSAPNETKVKGVKYTRDFEAEFSGKSFCLKGSGWPGQDYKRKQQMTRNNENAGKRTKKTWGDSPKLKPNYKGTECESWTEASNLRKSDKDKE